MSEASIEHQLAELTKVVYELKGAMEQSTAHTTPCKSLEEYKKEQSQKISALYKQIESHEDKHHSPSNSRASWLTVSGVISAIAMIATAIIMITKG